MHAFLIVGNTGEEHIATLLASYNAKRLDATVKTIEEARDLIKQTSLSFTAKTAIVLPHFSDVTPEAQNALLKLIEEPQDNLLFILTTSHEEGILPTIFSRVEIINNKKNQESKNTDADFLGLSAGAQLTQTTKIKTREDALAFVSSLLQSAHALLLKGESNEQAVAAIANAHHAIKRNGNIQLQLTHMITKLH